MNETEQQAFMRMLEENKRLQAYIQELEHRIHDLEYDCGNVITSREKRKEEHRNLIRENHRFRNEQQQQLNCIQDMKLFIQRQIEEQSEVIDRFNDLYQKHIDLYKSGNRTVVGVLTSGIVTLMIHDMNKDLEVGEKSLQKGFENRHINPDAMTPSEFSLYLFLRAAQLGQQITTGHNACDFLRAGLSVESLPSSLCLTITLLLREGKDIAPYVEKIWTWIETDVIPAVGKNDAPRKPDTFIEALEIAYAYRKRGMSKPQFTESDLHKSNRYVISQTKLNACLRCYELIEDESRKFSE